MSHTEERLHAEIGRTLDRLQAAHEEIDALREALRDVADNVTCGNCCECANDMRSEAHEALAALIAPRTPPTEAGNR